MLFSRKGKEAFLVFVKFKKVYKRIDKKRLCNVLKQCKELEAGKLSFHCGTSFVERREINLSLEVQDRRCCP